MLCCDIIQYPAAATQILNSRNATVSQYLIVVANIEEQEKKSLMPIQAYTRLPI